MIKAFISFSLCIVLASFLGGCKTTSTPSMTNAAGVSLQDICKKYNIQWQFDSVTQVVLLDYKNHKAKALIGSPVVLLGLEKITLDAPLRRVNSSIYVPEDFEDKVIGSFGVVHTRFGFSGDVSELKVRTIVIDAGHGGKDPGAKGHGGVREKDVVLDIAKRLKSILIDAGLKVVMTRDGDDYPTLEGRTEIATKVNADLFVSIHANANDSRRMEGIEVYSVKTQVKSDLNEEERQKNEKSFVRNLDSVSQPPVSLIVADMMYQLKVAESNKLAMRVVHDAASALQTPNRGARHARYAVLRNTLMPAILIETGFLTNRQEEKRLDSAIYRQKLAESIARSILAYASSN